MSHLLYEVDVTTHSEYFVYQHPQEAKLAAAIKDFVHDQHGTEPGGWSITEPNLLDLLGGWSNTHAVIVDLKPKAKSAVSLFRMRSILGFSYEDWTPVCFLLERLFENRLEADPKVFKEKFSTPSSGLMGKIAASPVYLRAGTHKGVWGWGRAGWVNGPMLWADSWRQFNHEIESSGWFEQEAHYA